MSSNIDICQPAKLFFTYSCGCKEWRTFDQSLLHRNDGPAVDTSECKKGHTDSQYFLYGHLFDKESYDRACDEAHSWIMEQIRDRFIKCYILLDHNNPVCEPFSDHRRELHKLFSKWVQAGGDLDNDIVNGLLKLQWESSKWAKKLKGG